MHLYCKWSNPFQSICLFRITEMPARLQKPVWFEQLPHSLPRRRSWQFLHPWRCLRAGKHYITKNCTNCNRREEMVEEMKEIKRLHVKGRSILLVFLNELWEMGKEKTNESKSPLCWTVPLKGVRHTRGHRTEPFQVMSSSSQAAPPES